MRVYLGDINEYKNNSKEINKKIRESDIKSMSYEVLFNNLMNGSIDINYVFKLGSDKGHSILSYFCQNEFHTQFIYKLLKNFPQININHKFDGKTSCFSLLLTHYNFLSKTGKPDGLDLADLFLNYSVDISEVEHLLVCLLYIDLNNVSNFDYQKYIILIKKIINTYNIDINKLLKNDKSAWEIVCYLIRVVVGKYKYSTEVTGYVKELVNFFLSKNPKIVEKNFIELCNGNEVMYDFLKLLMDNKK